MMEGQCEGRYKDTVSDIVKFNDLSNNSREVRGFEHPLIKLYSNLLHEEYAEEYLPAVAAESVEETLDALADIVVVALGHIHAMGFNPEEVMRAVNESNLSKFCYSEEEARQSVDSYIQDARYQDVSYIERDGVYVIVGRKVGADTSALKILKGINYQPPKILPIVYREYFENSEEENA